MRAVKQLPCCICNAPAPSDAHHCFHGRFGTAKDEAKNTIPLCKLHHQDGPDAIHNIKRTWGERYGPDHSYIPATRKMVEDLFAIFID